MSEQIEKIDLQYAINKVKAVETIQAYGKVVEIIGLIIEADGPKSSIGDLCYIYKDDSKTKKIMAEVVGYRANRILLMPLSSMEGIMAGAPVVNTGSDMKIKVSETMLGRVLDGLGEPIDGYGDIVPEKLYSTNAEFINPLMRKPIDEPLSLGIRAIDGFITVGKGQRMGIFAVTSLP